MKAACLGLIALVALSVSGCQSTGEARPDILSGKPAVELRTMQTRTFDTADRARTLRAVIATLQDLGYIIDKVEPAAGTVSATKLSVLRLSAAVYPRGSTQVAVRANALVRVSQDRDQNTQVDDPQFYQQFFFEPLSKAMFLSALQAGDGVDAPPPPPLPKASERPEKKE